MISKELFCKTIADIQEDVARIPPHSCGGGIATQSKPLSDDEFSFGGAYEALVMAGEHQTQMEDTENEIKALTDKIRLLSMVEQISYLMLSFGIMFACTLLFVTGIIAVGVLAANVYAK